MKWVRKIPARYRRLLLIGVAAVCLFFAGATLYGLGVFTKPLNTFGQVSFERPLPIPALAQPTTDDDGTRRFALNLQTGSRQFVDGRTTPTWGVNGDYLAPTIRVKRGETVAMEVRNALPEASSLHWHGMELPPAMDGGPHQPVAAGETWRPTWRVDQPAATLWYHPHPHGRTEKHIYRGVAGMLIVEDDVVQGLPNRYGIDDIPVIIQDKKFNRSGQLDETASTAAGIIGDTIVVNGAVTPHLTAETGIVRLRLLNASTGRIYNFGLSNGNTMQQIASDGGLLERPLARDRIVLSPGERAEVLVAMRPSERVSLRSYPMANTSAMGIDKRTGGQDSLEIMQIRAAGQLAPAAEVPANLANVSRYQPAEARQTRRFDLTSLSSINGLSMDMNRIDFQARRGDTEVWEVHNADGMTHNFHVHGTQFQVLSLDGAAPPPELAGWKDTVMLRSQQTVRLIMRFERSDDSGLPYMYHCHLTNHEDQGMMGQFTVADGDAAQRPSTRLQHEDH